MSEETLQSILSSLRTLRYNQTSIIESLLLLSDTMYYQSQRYELPRHTYSRYASGRNYDPFTMSQTNTTSERRPHRGMYSNTTTRPSNTFSRTNPDRASNIEISFMDNSSLSTSEAISQLMTSVLGTGASESRSLSLNTIQEETEVVHFSDIESPSETMCPICRIPFDNNSIIRKIKHCNHYFHINCIDNWFKENKTCPVCRHDLTSTTRPESLRNTRAGTNL